MLNFSCVKPIKTVYTVLEEHNAVDLLRDDLITVATKEIYSEGRSRREIQKDIKSKEKAIEALASRYERGDLSQENIRQCLYSIGDNHSFLRTNRDPCERMIGYLKQYFHPTRAENNKTSLAIRFGKNGARLSHDHEKQYSYVLQSLSLWREILHGMSCPPFSRVDQFGLTFLQICFIYGRSRSKTCFQRTWHTVCVILVKDSTAFKRPLRRLG